MPPARHIGLLILCTVFLLPALQAQESAQQQNDTALSRLEYGRETPDLARRKWLVAGGHAAVWAGSFIALNQAWYAQYERSHFHFFNDWDEWLQMDKAGHLWSGYQISRLSADMWRWAGMDRRKAAWVGGASSVAYMSIIEILDGFSAEWGFSTGDMLMNIAGAGTMVAQELAWQDQRIQIKMSYLPYSYPPDLDQRADDLFGNAAFGRVLKDYNAQTYWLSFNLKSFTKSRVVPRWLNLSLGYNARLMLGAESNIWTDEKGEQVDRSDIPRYRRFFLSLDADLTKIRTRSKFLRSLFSVVNTVKMPAPALEWNTREGFRFHGIYF